jgi:tetratricopeptide (TPR) repeat protein
MRIVPAALVVLMPVACSGPSFERFVASGERYVAEQRYADAVIEFENAARLDPQSAFAQLKLGDAYAELNQLTYAAAAYERACTLNEQDAAACLRAATQLLSFGEHDRAVAMARIVLTSDQSNLDAQLILAGAMAGARRFADAEEQLQAAMATAPRDARPLAALGDLQRQRGRVDAAETSLLRAIDMDPSSSDARVSLAQLYLEMGRGDAGAQQLRAALDANPDDLAANRAYASYLVGTDQCENAEQYWQKVAEQSEDPADTLALADYYVWMERSDAALGILKELMARGDEGGAAKARAASILYDRGDREQASKMIDEILRQDQSSVAGLLLKARMALDAHDTARAREYAHKAAAVAPQAPAVRDLLAALAETKP